MKIDNQKVKKIYHKHSYIFGKQIVQLKNMLVTPKSIKITFSEEINTSNLNSKSSNKILFFFLSFQDFIFPSYFILFI